MAPTFRETVAAALPSEDHLHARLAALSRRDWENLAFWFAAILPEVDAVLALPDAVPLATALARARGIPVLNALTWRQEEARGSGEAVLVTRHLTDGLPELEALLRAERRGLRVLTVAAAVERSNALGRTRLELQQVPVRAAVRLADTPAGLTFERRTPRRWPQAS